MRRWVAVAAMLVVAACGGSDDPAPAKTSTPPSTTTPAHTLSPPEATVDALMRALDAGDCDTAKELVVTPSELGCDIVEEMKDSFAAEGIDLDAVTYAAGAVHDASTT